MPTTTSPRSLEGQLPAEPLRQRRGPKLLVDQATQTDKTTRESEIGEIQDKVAADLSTLPLLQGKQVANVGSSVEGAVLDGSFKFRYAPLHK